MEEEIKEYKTFKDNPLSFLVQYLLLFFAFTILLAIVSYVLIKLRNMLQNVKDKYEKTEEIRKAKEILEEERKNKKEE